MLNCMFSSYELFIIFIDWILLTKNDKNDKNCKNCKKMFFLNTIKNVNKFTFENVTNHKLFIRHKSACLLNNSFCKYGLDSSLLIESLYDDEDNIYSNGNRKIYVRPDMLKDYKSFLFCIYNMYFGYDEPLKKYKNSYKYNKIYNYANDIFCPLKNLSSTGYRRFDKLINESLNLSLAIGYAGKPYSSKLLSELDD